MTNPRRRERGFTLLESLATMVLLSIAVMLAIYLVTDRVRSSKVRVAARQFAMDLRAVRLQAVSNRSAVNVVVTADPGNVYQYTDTHGRKRMIALPHGVRIVSSSSPIQFRSNGSVLGGASTVFETYLSNGAIDRWTVNTSVLGISSTTHLRVGP